MNFSVDVVKKNLKWIVCAALGLLHFILLFFPYLGAGVSYGGYSQSESLSGYETFGEDLGEMEVGGLAVFFQVLTLIGAIALLAVGVYLLLKAFFGVDLPDAFGPIEVKKVAGIVHIVYGALNILTWISFLIVGIANSRSMMGAKLSVGPHIGMYLALILSVGSVVGLYFLEKNCPDFFKVDATKFVCSNCGAKASANQGFCKLCGGKIEEVANVPTTYACSQCHAPAKAGTAFCPQCGGKVEEIRPAAIPVFVCEQCGASAKEGASFCGQCGGKIIQK